MTPRLRPFPGLSTHHVITDAEQPQPWRSRRRARCIDVPTTTPHNARPLDDEHEADGEPAETTSRGCGASAETAPADFRGSRSGTSEAPRKPVSHRRDSQ